MDFFNQVFRQQVLYPSKFALLSLRISRSFPLSFCFNSSHSRLRVPSPKLGAPRSGSEAKLSFRRFSCRVLPPQLAATADVWKGVFDTAVQCPLQSLSGSPATVPLIKRGVRRKEQKAQTQTAQGLEAICLKVCYRIPSDEQQPHRTTNQCSSPFTGYSQIGKYANLIPF